MSLALFILVIAIFCFGVGVLVGDLIMKTGDVIARRCWHAMQATREPTDQ